MDRGRAELPLATGFHVPAELLRHRLHAVTDSQRRQAAVQGPGWSGWSARIVYRGRTARQDHPARTQPLHFLPGRGGRRKFAIDVQFTHPPGDQHRGLRAKIDDHD